MSKNRTPLYVLVISVILSTLVIIFAAMEGNPPQCGSGQVPEADNCIIGANIGGGLLVFLGIGVYIIGAMLAFMFYMIQTLRNKASGWQAIGKILLVATVGIGISAAGISLLIDNFPKSDL